MSNKIRSFLVAAGFLFAIFALACCNTNPGKTKPEKIDYIVEKAFKNQKFIGNVLVINEGNIIYEKSFGKANAESDIPNSDSTKFLLASLSKPFTTILILKLAEQDKIKLTDEIGNFFSEVRNSKIGKVKIHHLLTHTSGIKEFISEKHIFEAKDLMSSSFNFDPGSNFEYSNSGYVLLKEIAAISSSKTYEKLMQELIFTPLKMTSSGVARNVSTIPDLAVGYKDAAQEQPDKITYSLETVDGAGSLFTTTSDMVRFNEGLSSEEFLSKSLRELMLRQHVEKKFGYGWYLRERGGIWDVYYHKGNLPGYTSFLSGRANTNQMILLLANAGGLDLDDLENDIAHVLKSK